MGGMFVLGLPPEDIEALRAGRRVTRTYPEPLPHGPPPFLPEDLKAMKGGKRVIRMMASFPAPVLQVGNVLPVMSSESRPRQPPGLLPEDLEALRAGKTVTKESDRDLPPPRMHFDLHVKVVEYGQQGHDHIYTFESV